MGKLWQEGGAIRWPEARSQGMGALKVMEGRSRVYSNKCQRLLRGSMQEMTYLFQRDGRRENGLKGGKSRRGDQKGGYGGRHRKRGWLG